MQSLLRYYHVIITLLSRCYWLHNAVLQDWLHAFFMIMHKSAPSAIYISLLWLALTGICCCHRGLWRGVLLPTAWNHSGDHKLSCFSIKESQGQSIAMKSFFNCFYFVFFVFFCFFIVRCYFILSFFFTIYYLLFMIFLYFGFYFLFSLIISCFLSFSLIFRCFLLFFRCRLLICLRTSDWKTSNRTNRYVHARTCLFMLVLTS